MSKHDTHTLALVRSAKSGDQRAYTQIFHELEPDLKKIGSRFYIVGSDREDVMQECRLGVVKAINAFDENGGMNFRNFALNVCVPRHLKTAISHANRFKYARHNQAFSLNSPVITNDDEVDQTMADFIPDQAMPLLEGLLLQDEFEEVSRRLRKRLTELEEAIFLEYSHDSSYKDIADRLGVQPKTVDNALMRIRKKAVEVYQAFITERDGDGFET